MHTQRVANKKIIWKMHGSLLLLLYLTLAIPLALDIWGIRKGTNVDTYGRIMVSIIVLGVVCPIIVLSMISVFYRLKNAILSRSFFEFFSPREYWWLDMHNLGNLSLEVNFLRKGGILYITTICAAAVLVLVFVMIHLPNPG